MWAASSASLSTAAASAPPASSGTATASVAATGGARHRANEAFEHSGDLVATVGEVVVVDVVFQIAAEDQHVAERLEAGLGEVVVMGLVSGAAALEALGDRFGNLNGGLLHHGRETLLLLRRDPGGDLEDAEDEGVGLLPDLHLLERGDAVAVTAAAVAGAITVSVAAVFAGFAVVTWGVCRGGLVVHRGFSGVEVTGTDRGVRRGSKDVGTL